MLQSRLLRGVALAALCLSTAVLNPVMPLGAVQAQAQSGGVTFQLFFDQLEPHGVWVRHAQYRNVFCPTGVPADWRPYTNGRWLYLDGRGWYFASDEPFAWATYHYGRWFADPSLGWCWVPGTKWAPAWVTWRRSDTVVGWAPLPPEGEGYAVSVEVSRRELPEGYWVFVPTKRFVEPDLSINIVIGSQQPDYFAQTQFVGPVVVEGDIVINNVIEVTYIEQVINQQVIVYQPDAVEDPAAQSIDVDAQAIAIFDVDLAEPTQEEAPPEAVEEADAAATIETEGGTAGATAELPAEDAVAAPAEPAADQPATEEPAAEAPAPDAAAPGAQLDAAAPAEQPAAEAPAAPAAETPAPAAADEATPVVPTDGEELLCAPEVMVDGKCPPPVEGTKQPAPEQPADQAPAEAVPADPADAAQVEPEAAPDDPAAAPTEQRAEEVAPGAAAPADEAAPEGAAPPKRPLCPPEQMVDGKCPVLPGQETPAQ